MGLAKNAKNTKSTSSPTREARIQKALQDLKQNPLLPRRSSRREAYLTDLSNPQELPGYAAAFAAGIQRHQARLHRDQLPPPPRHWKDLQSHLYRLGFTEAARKEFQDLQRRGTFEPVQKSQGLKPRPLPLKWVFTYKYDTGGYLLKFKARICVRGGSSDSVGPAEVSRERAATEQGKEDADGDFDCQCHRYRNKCRPSDIFVDC